LREYLARAVRKATGAHNASLVTPNHRPVFPPMPPEAIPASLEAQGNVIFRAVPATTPGTPVGLQVASVAPSNAQQRPADEHRETSEVLNNAKVLNPAARDNRITGRHTAHVAVENAIAAVVRAIDGSSRDSKSQQPSSGDVSAAALPNQDSMHDGITGNESALRPGLSQKIEPSIVQELHEPAEVSQLAPRQNSFRDGASATAQETAVQVRIGRIEVRVAAPVPVPAPPAAKRQGPRGFAEYEAVRRYMTRSRM
jgi:hypothetical protein